MKILHTSDWHIGRSLFEFSLLEDQAYLFQQLYQIIEENQVETVVVAGDLYDRSLPSAQAVELLDEVFHTLIHKLRCKVIAVSGNHDSSKRLAYGNRFFAESGLYLEGLWQPEWKCVTLEDPFGPIHFYLLPYFIPQEVRNRLEDKSIDSFTKAFEALMSFNLPRIHPSERNMLVAHGFYMKLRQSELSGQEEISDPVCSGSELSVGTSDLTDLSSASLFDYVALGHLHSPQRAGCDTMRYSGSLMKYSLSEADNPKSVTLLDWKEKGNLEITQIPLHPKRELHVITGTMDQILDRNGYTDIGSEDFIFANIIHTGAVLNAMGQLRSVFPNALGLSFILPDQETAELSTGFSLSSRPMDELFGQFYEDVTGEPLNAERQEIVKSLTQKLLREE